MAAPPQPPHDEGRARSRTSPCAPESSAPAPWTAQDGKRAGKPANRASCSARARPRAPSPKNAMMPASSEPKCSASPIRPSPRLRPRCDALRSLMRCIHCQADQKPIAAPIMSSRRREENAGAERRSSQPARETTAISVGSDDGPAEDADLAEAATRATARRLLARRDRARRRWRAASATGRGAPSRGRASVTRRAPVRATAPALGPQQMRINCRTARACNRVASTLARRSASISAARSAATWRADLARSSPSCASRAAMRLPPGRRAHRQHAAAHRAIAPACPSAPRQRDDRGRQHGQEIGVAGEDAEASAFVLGAQRWLRSGRSMTVSRGRRQRRAGGMTPFAARLGSPSLARASSSAPTM